MEKKVERTASEIGRIGGINRSKNLTKQQRSEIARNAVNARWNKVRMEKEKQEKKKFQNTRIIGIDGIDFEYVLVTREEMNHLLDDGYLPVILRAVFDRKTIALMQIQNGKRKVEIWYNHGFSGSGANNFVLSNRFDLEFNKSARWISDTGHN